MLAKTKLNSIEIIKALIDSNICHDEFILINNLLKEYDDVKEEIQDLKLKQFIKDFSVFIKQCYFYWRFWSIYKTVLMHYLKCRKNT